MRYFTSIYSVETYSQFSAGDRSLAVFSAKNKPLLAKIQPGDRIVCYLAGLSAFFAVLEVMGALRDLADGSPYPLAFPVRILAWQNQGTMLPVKREAVWQALSFTHYRPVGAGGWNATLRRSGTRMLEEDGHTITRLLLALDERPEPDGFPAEAWTRSPEATAGATVCETTDPVVRPEPVGAPEYRTSLKMQAVLADIGATMGFQVWIPAADRGAVEALMNSETDCLLHQLPAALVSDPVALRTIEQIDVLWLYKSTVKRAFEVEHTTAVYSGILRMADLLALQPNFHTRLHLVAPAERRAKVFHELARPAFSMYPQGAMFALCTYIEYEALKRLADSPFLRSMNDSALDLIAEQAPGLTR